MVEQHDYRIAQYVAFGFLVMTTVGQSCLMPFVTLHLKHLGLSATQVGLMRSAQSAVALCSIPLSIQCAFHYKKRQLVIALSLCFSIVAYLVISAIPPMTTSNYQTRCNVNASKTAPQILPGDNLKTGTSRPDSESMNARLTTSIKYAVSEPPKNIAGNLVSPKLPNPATPSPNASRPLLVEHRRRVGFKSNQWKPKKPFVPQSNYLPSLEYEDISQEDYGSSLKNRNNKAMQKPMQLPSDVEYQIPSANGQVYDYQEPVNFGAKSSARRTFPKNTQYQTKLMSKSNHLTHQLNRPGNINDYEEFVKAVPRHLAMYEDSPVVRRGADYANVLMEDPKSAYLQNKNVYGGLRRRNIVEDAESNPYSVENPHYGEYDYNDYSNLSPDYRKDTDRAYEMADISQELWERLRLPRSNTRHHVLKRVLKLVPSKTQQNIQSLNVDLKKSEQSSSTVFPVNTTATKRIGRRILEFYADIDKELDSPDQDQPVDAKPRMEERMDSVENNFAEAEDTGAAVAGRPSSNALHKNAVAINSKTLKEVSTKKSELTTNSPFSLQNISSGSDHYAFVLTLLLLIAADLFGSSAAIMSDEAWYEFLDDMDELQLYGKHRIPAQLLSSIAVFGTSMAVAATSCLMFNIDHFKIYFYAYAIIAGDAVILSLCFPVVTSKFSLSSDPPKTLQRLKILFASPTATLFAVTVAFGGMWTACSHDYLLWAIEDLGGNEYHFAFAIPVGILSEMVSPSLAKKLIRRFKISKSLALVVCVHSARLMVTALLQTPVGLILGQGLQFVSVSTIHIIVRAYMLHIADPSLNHVMQSSLSTVVHRFGQACGSLIFGPLYDYLGITGMFLTASITALVWGLFLFAVHKRVTVDNNELCFQWQTPYISKMETLPSLLESESDDDWLQDAIKKDTYKLKTQAY